SAREQSAGSSLCNRLRRSIGTSRACNGTSRESRGNDRGSIQMNRSEIYSGEQGRTFDVLWGWKDVLAALGAVETSLAGNTNTVLAGFAATASAPASLVINLAQGWIYQQSALDSTSYGSLPSDSTIVQQQGYAIAQTVTLTTSGLSSGQ